MAKKLSFLAALLFFYVTVSAQSNYVTLYENCNYSGKRHYLEAGSYRAYLMKIENDNLSSMQIPSGMKVTIYEHDEFKGKSKTFYSSIACLDNEWNEMASSIVIENQNYQPGYGQPGYGQTDYITFFNDCYSQGYSQSLRPGTYSGNQLGQLRYNISSFAIYGNLQVRVYLNNENNAGYSSTFEANQACLSSSYNDRIGSLVIEYKSTSGNNYPGTGNGNYATIYTDCSYRGNSLRLAPGYYQGDKLGLLRYDISSIELPSNLKARVYVNNENLNGSYYILTETSSCLSSTLNNRIGSLIIEESYGNNNNNNNNNNYPSGNFERVVLYSDANYRGQSASLLPGTYPSMPQAGFLDKALSSLTVPVGYRVVLYEFINFKGKSYTITASKSMFTLSGWNDKASSIAVYRDR